MIGSDKSRSPPSSASFQPGARGDPASEKQSHMTEGILELHNLQISWVRKELSEKGGSVFCITPHQNIDFRILKSLFQWNTEHK